MMWLNVEKRGKALGEIKEQAMGSLECIIQLL